MEVPRLPWARGEMGGIHYFLLNFFLNMEYEVLCAFKLYAHMTNRRPDAYGRVIESRRNAGAEATAAGLLFRDHRSVGGSGGPRVSEDLCTH